MASEVRNYLLPINPKEAFSSQEYAEEIPNLPTIVVDNKMIAVHTGEQTVIHTPDSSRTIIQPNELLKYVRSKAKSADVSPWQIVEELRKFSGDSPEKIEKTKRHYKETFAYISDIHEGGELFFKSLDEMLTHPPQYVIFLGDAFGGDHERILKRYFYNYLNNLSIPFIRQNPDATDEEIVNFSGGSAAPEENYSLTRGFLQIRRYELVLEGKSDQEITDHLTGLTISDIASQIKRYSRFVHSGHYMSCLPEATRKTLAKESEESIDRIAQYIKKFKETGTKVIILEGNCDTLTSTDYDSDEGKLIVLPEEKRLFQAKKVLESHEINLLEHIQTLETETTLHIFSPYYTLLKNEEIPEELLKEIEMLSKKARSTGKRVVIVSHSEPTMEIHNKPASGEHPRVIKGMAKIIQASQPNEIIYGHIHDPILPNNPELSDYRIDIKNGSIRLVPNQETDEQFTTARYLPLKKIRRLDREK